MPAVSPRVTALIAPSNSPPLAPLPPPLPVAPSAAPAKSPALIALLLALMMGLQPITTDLYLPALPSLADELHASTAQAQLTLTALLLCFGSSQLVFGPLSDRFGRRPILLIGLALYTLAALGNVLAASIEWLIATRAVQGVAMGAVVMCARAIVRDLFTPAQGARVMAKALGGLGAIAMLSPLAGGFIAAGLGWRWALAVLALFSAAVLALVLLRFEESLAAPNPRALHAASLLRNWASVLRHPGFLAWAGLLAATYGGLFTFLAASSFVFLKVYGLSKTEYGWAMATPAFVYILGTFLCRRLLPRLGLRGAVRIGGALTLTGGTVIGVLGLLGVHTWWAFLLPYYLFMLGHGIHQPCTQTGAVGPFPQMAGVASAWSGFFLTVVAFGVGLWLGQRLDGTVYPLTNGVWFWSVVIALLAWGPVQRWGDSGPVASEGATP